MRGFLESRFELANDSRVPIWFKQQVNSYSRENLTVILRYYTPFFDVDNAVLTLELKDGSSIKTVTGKNVRHPSMAKVENNCSSRSAIWPRYVTILVNGESEIIQFRKMEPIFYISDEEDMKNNPPKCNTPKNV